jgi:hypothetical protein
LTPRRAKRHAAPVLLDAAMRRCATAGFRIVVLFLIFFTGLLFKTYHNAFRQRLQQEPPAYVRPLKIELKQDAKPKRIPARKYAPPQAQFPAAKMADMERLGLVKKNLTSRWASPPLILLKAGPEKFRFTLDLRYPNSQT